MEGWKIGILNTSSTSTKRLKRSHSDQDQGGSSVDTPSKAYVRFRRFPRCKVGGGVCGEAVAEGMTGYSTVMPDEALGGALGP